MKAAFWSFVDDLVHVKACRDVEREEDGGEVRDVEGDVDRGGDNTDDARAGADTNDEAGEPSPQLPPSKHTPNCPNILPGLLARQKSLKALGNRITPIVKLPLPHLKFLDLNLWSNRMATLKSKSISSSWSESGGGDALPLDWSIGGGGKTY
ncbi:hypothetical protein CY34DRAFT_19556 [Suillus luteus UH-Slu-Lm8-n1]|uniref:Uncharacterized protein n=1 Tax=Suillus luteus UH-Slu-Lm8-n1 TaxID=930992 RepID=A0A0D0A0U4_9AGAM|nr:hypothetical protein CY34DRAFT_19556 [Suillus luteus UH-Slu-Lm8-n1]